MCMCVSHGFRLLCCSGNKCGRRNNIWCVLGWCDFNTCMCRVDFRFVSSVALECVKCCIGMYEAQWGLRYESLKMITYQPCRVNKPCDVLLLTRT